MKTMRLTLEILALAALLLFAGCDSEVVSKFQIQYRGPDLRVFLEPGARTVAFPVVTREFTSLKIDRSSKQFEELLALHQRDLPVIPFEDFYATLVDSGADRPLVEALNRFYKDGEIPTKAADRMARCGAQYEPKFFLFLKLDRAEAYRDNRRESKIQLLISGKLYYIRKKAVVLSFVCAVSAGNRDKNALPGVAELSGRAVEQIAKGLPSDPGKSVLLEKRDDW
ncbi:MAG: hypothetical protein V1913_11825 [Fibrobacterota bacterium]